MNKKNTKPTKSLAPATSALPATPVARRKSAPSSRAKGPASSRRTAKAIPTAERPTSVQVAVAPEPPVAPQAAPTTVAVPPPPTPKVIPVKPVEPQPAATTIFARIDVGFGNALYLRGEGPGLSWDAGLPMECVEDDLWKMTLGDSPGGFTFKFLVNDLAWSKGADCVIASGASETFVPEF